MLEINILHLIVKIRNRQWRSQGRAGGRGGSTPPVLPWLRHFPYDDYYSLSTTTNLVIILYQHFLCMLGRGKTNDPSPMDKESYGMLE